MVSFHEKLRQKQVQNRDETGAIASGILNLPIDFTRYGAHALNYGANLVGATTNSEYDDYNRRIKSFHDRPPFFPDSFNDTRQRLAEEYPGRTAGGEILAGGLTRVAGAKLGKFMGNSPRFDRGEGLYKNFMDLTHHLDTRTLRGKLAQGLGFGAIEEYGREPLYDNLINIQPEQKKTPASPKQMSGFMEELLRQELRKNSK